MQSEEEEKQLHNFSIKMRAQKFVVEDWKKVSLLIYFYQPHGSLEKSNHSLTLVLSRFQKSLNNVAQLMFALLKLQFIERINLKQHKQEVNHTRPLKSLLSGRPRRSLLPV